MNADRRSVAVRAIEENDYEQWLQLWLAYQDFYQVTLSEQITHTSFKRFLEPDEPVFSAVAVQDGQLSGLVNSVIHRSTWSIADSCYLEDLYVAPDIRGAGTGRALIAWVREFARRRQCARLYWHTHATNQQAQALYDRVAQRSGFIEYRMDL